MHLGYATLFGPEVVQYGYNSTLGAGIGIGAAAPPAEPLLFHLLNKLYERTSGFENLAAARYSTGHEQLPEHLGIGRLDEAAQGERFAFWFKDAPELHNAFG